MSGGHPAHKREDAAGRERQDAPAAIENSLLGDATEANSVLNAFFKPEQLDLREITHDASPAAVASSLRN